MTNPDLATRNSFPASPALFWEEGVVYWGPERRTFEFCIYHSCMVDRLLIEWERELNLTAFGPFSDKARKGR